MIARLRNYRDNPIVFVRLPRRYWLTLQRMAAKMGMKPGDVMREMVANAIAAVDPSSLPPHTTVDPLRQPIRWISTQAWETSPYQWFRRLKLAARTRANGGMYSIDIENSRLGFFGHLSMCIAIFQYCERYGFTPHVRCTSPNYVDPERGPDWLEYYFDKPEANSSRKSLARLKYTTTMYDVNTLLGLDVRPGTSIEDALRVFNRYLTIKPHIVETVERFWKNLGSNRPVVGIHYRGTDKSLEAPRVSPEHCLMVLRRYIEKNTNITAVFVASDEQSFIDLIKKSIKELPVFSRDDHSRSRDRQPVHHVSVSEGGGYAKGEDALVNALLLAKCATLIRTTSLLSASASLFNPYLKVILLNKAYGNMLYPESEILKQPSTEYFPETFP